MTAKEKKWSAQKDSPLEVELPYITRPYISLPLFSMQQQEHCFFSDDLLIEITAFINAALALNGDGQCYIGFIMVKAKLVP